MLRVMSFQIMTAFTSLPCALAEPEGRGGIVLGWLSAHAARPGNSSWSALHPLQARPMCVGTIACPLS